MSPHNHLIGRLGVRLALLAFVSVLAGAASAATSYAVAAEDDPGSSTGADTVAIGVPDYQFVNDIGFGGANADIFGPGESTVLSFPVAIRNIADQPDLLISAFVGGAGATDGAEVQVDVSSDGIDFTEVATFDTTDGRNVALYPFPEVAFESVKHFAIELGSASAATHVRLTNLASTAEGLRLDAVEGLQPATASSHAFEIRFEKYRGDEVGRFLVRIKNTARPNGVAIRELRIDKSTTPGVTLEDTVTSLCEQREQVFTPLTTCPEPGSFVCVENCILDNGPSIPFSRHVWSIDGENEAPAGTGLEPGRQAMHLRNENFDTDGTLLTFLGGFAFTVTFADGFEHSFTFSDDVLDQATTGSLFQKYLYFSNTPTVFGPRPVYYYEFVPEPEGAGAAIAAVAALLALTRRRASMLHREARSTPETTTQLHANQLPHTT